MPNPPVRTSPVLTIEQRKIQERARIKKLQEAERARKSASNMTPAQKAAYLNNQNMDY